MSAAKAFWAAYLARDVRTAAACVAVTTRSDQLRRILAGDAAVETARGWKVESFDI